MVTMEINQIASICRQTDINYKYPKATCLDKRE